MRYFVIFLVICVAQASEMDRKDASQADNDLYFDEEPRSSASGAHDPQFLKEQSYVLESFIVPSIASNLYESISRNAQHDIVLDIESLPASSRSSLAVDRTEILPSKASETLRRRKRMDMNMNVDSGQMRGQMDQNQNIQMASDQSVGTFQPYGYLTPEARDLSMGGGSQANQNQQMNQMNQGQSQQGSNQQNQNQNQQTNQGQSQQMNQDMNQGQNQQNQNQGQSQQQQGNNQQNQNQQLPNGMFLSTIGNQVYTLSPVYAQPSSIQNANPAPVAQTASGLPAGSGSGSSLVTISGYTYSMSVYTNMINGLPTVGTSMVGPLMTSYNGVLLPQGQSSNPYGYPAQGSYEIAGPVSTTIDSNGYPYTVSAYTKIIDNKVTYGAVTLRGQTTLYNGNPIPYGKNVFGFDNKGTYTIDGPMSVTVLNGITQTVSSYTKVVDGLATYGTVTMQAMQTYFVPNGGGQQFSGNQVVPDNNILVYQNQNQNSNQAANQNQIQNQNQNQMGNMGGQPQQSGRPVDRLGFDLGQGQGNQGVFVSGSANQGSFGQQQSSNQGNSQFVTSNQGMNQGTSQQSFGQGSSSLSQGQNFGQGNSGSNQGVNNQQQSFSQGNQGINPTPTNQQPFPPNGVRQKGTYSYDLSTQSSTINNIPVILKSYVMYVDGTATYGSATVLATATQYGQPNQQVVCVECIEKPTDNALRVVLNGNRNQGQNANPSPNQAALNQGQQTLSLITSTAYETFPTVYNGMSVMGKRTRISVFYAPGQTVGFQQGPGSQLNLSPQNQQNSGSQNQQAPDQSFIQPTPVNQGQSNQGQQQQNNFAPLPQGYTVAPYTMLGDNKFLTYGAMSFGYPQNGNGQPTAVYDFRIIQPGNAIAGTGAFTSTMGTEVFSTVYQNQPVMGTRTVMNFYYVGGGNSQASPVQSMGQGQGAQNRIAVQQSQNQGDEQGQNLGGQQMQNQGAQQGQQQKQNKQEAVPDQQQPVTGTLQLFFQQPVTINGPASTVAPSMRSISEYSIQGSDRLLTTGKVIFVASATGQPFYTATDIRTVSPTSVQAGSSLTVTSRLEAFFVPLSNSRIHGERTRYTYFYVPGNSGGGAQTGGQVPTPNQAPLPASPAAQAPASPAQAAGPVGVFASASSSSGGGQSSFQSSHESASNVGQTPNMIPFGGPQAQAISRMKRDHVGSDAFGFSSVSEYSILATDGLLTTGAVTFFASATGQPFFAARDLRTVKPAKVRKGVPVTMTSRLEAFFVPVNNSRIRGERTRVTYFPVSQSDITGARKGGSVPMEAIRVKRNGMNPDDGQVRASFSVSSYTRGRIRGAVTYFIPIAHGGQNPNPGTFSMRDLQTMQPSGGVPANAVPIEVTHKELFKTVYNGALITGTRTRIEVTYGAGGGQPQFTGDFSVRMNAIGDNRVQAATVLSNQFGNGISIPDNTIFDDNDIMPSKALPMGSQDVGGTPSIELFTAIINGQAVQGRRTRFNGQVNSVVVNRGGNGGFVNGDNMGANQIPRNPVRSGKVTVMPFNSVDNGQSVIGQRMIFMGNPSPRIVDFASVQGNRVADVGQMGQRKNIELFDTVINGVAVQGTRTRFIDTFTAAPLQLGSRSGDMFGVIRDLPCPCDCGFGQSKKKRSADTHNNVTLTELSAGIEILDNNVTIHNPVKKGANRSSAAGVRTGDSHSNVSRGLRDMPVDLFCFGNFSGLCASELEVCQKGKTAFQCRCIQGYKRDASDGLCKDVDECAETTANSCAADSVCYNSMGTYACVCESGYFDRSPPGLGSGRVCLSSEVNAELPSDYRPGESSSRPVQSCSDFYWFIGDKCQIHWLGLSVGLAALVLVVVLLVTCVCYFRARRRKRQVSYRETFFASLYSPDPMHKFARFDSADQARKPGKRSSGSSQGWDFPRCTVDQPADLEPHRSPSLPARYAGIGRGSSLGSELDADRVSCGSGENLIRNDRLRAGVRRGPGRPVVVVPRRMDSFTSNSTTSDTLSEIQTAPNPTIRSNASRTKL